LPEGFALFGGDSAYLQLHAFLRWVMVVLRGGVKQAGNGGSIRFLLWGAFRKSVCDSRN
jgi:hypothetical protein